MSDGGLHHGAPADTAKAVRGPECALSMNSQRKPAVHPTDPLTILGLGGPDVPTSCRASALDPRHLAVEIEAAPKLIHELAQKMVHGALSVEFQGRQLVLTHFTVFNQGDRGRLVFTAAHRAA